MDLGQLESSKSQDRLQKRVDRLVRQGRFDRAVEILEMATAIDPSDWYIHYLLGWTLSRAGRLRAAEISYSRAIELNAQDPRLKATVGEFYLGIEKPELAAPLLSEAVEQWPDSSEAHSFYGRALLDLGEYEKAKPVLTTALRLSKYNPDARAEMIRLYENTGREDLISESLQGYLREASDLACSHVFMADYLFFEQGDCASALPYYEKGLLLAERSNSRSWFKQYFSAMNYPDEIVANYLNALVECDLDDIALAMAREHRGKGHFEAFRATIHEKAGRTEEAMADMEKALRKDPNAYEWRYQLGRLRLASGDFESAEADISAAIEAGQAHGPIDWWFLGALAVCLRVQEKSEELMELRGSVPEGHFSRFMASMIYHYSLLEHWESVIETCREVLDVTSNDVHALKHMAHALVETSRIEEGIQAYRKLIELQPRNPRHDLALSQAYARIGDLDAVEQSIRSAIDSGRLSKPQLARAEQHLTQVRSTGDPD